MRLFMSSFKCALISPHGHVLALFCREGASMPCVLGELQGYQWREWPAGEWEITEAGEEAI